MHVNPTARPDVWETAGRYLATACALLFLALEATAQEAPCPYTLNLSAQVPNTLGLDSAAGGSVPVTFTDEPMIVLATVGLEDGTVQGPDPGTAKCFSEYDARLSLIDLRTRTEASARVVRSVEKSRFTAQRLTFSVEELPPGEYSLSVILKEKARELQSPAFTVARRRGDEDAAARKAILWRNLFRVTALADYETIARALMSEFHPDDPHILLMVADRSLNQVSPATSGRYFRAAVEAMNRHPALAARTISRYEREVAAVFSRIFDDAVVRERMRNGVTVERIPMNGHQSYAWRWHERLVPIDPNDPGTLLPPETATAK